MCRKSWSRYQARPRTNPIRERPWRSRLLSANSADRSRTPIAPADTHRTALEPASHKSGVSATLFDVQESEPDGGGDGAVGFDKPIKGAGFRRALVQKEFNAAALLAKLHGGALLGFGCGHLWLIHSRLGGLCIASGRQTSRKANALTIGGDGGRVRNPVCRVEPKE